MAVTLDTTYAVGSGDITLTITIGDGQLGSSRVTLGKKVLAEGDEIATLPIGKGSILRDKAIQVKSVVSDVNDQTNHTSITYSLRGGPAAADYRLASTVAEEGDSVIYRATIRFLLVCALVLAAPARAQSPASVKLEDLRTPPSPVLVLLGVAPSAVERPTSPRAVAVSLLRAAGDSGLFPRHYALEIAPYWLTSHPSLTFAQYYHPSLARSLAQTLSVSFATSPLRDAADSADVGTSVGVGVRALLVSGKPSRELDSLRALLSALQRRVLAASGDSEEQRALAALKPVAVAIQSAGHERTGWIVELAAAATGNFPGDVAANGKTGMVGVWLTPAYRRPGGSLDLLGVFRVLRDERPDTARTYLDGGFRLAWRGQGVLSAELVERYQSAGGSKHDYRLSGTFEYPLTSAIRLTAAVGRDFALGAPAGRTLLAQVSVNFGMGAIPVLRLAS
jgi:hypothetical protein